MASVFSFDLDLSETFSSHQGVKQGGLLSAELYKLYIEDLLKTYENSKLG
jgi:hypothetical protein